jgi:hypothetical protein
MALRVQFAMYPYHWILPSSQPAFPMILLPQPGPGRGFKCIKSVFCRSGGPVLVPTISEMAPSDLAIVGELPKSMDSSTSDTIQVKLSRAWLDSQERNGSFTIKDRTILLPDISNSLNDDMGDYCLLHASSYNPLGKVFLVMGHEQ